MWINIKMIAFGGLFLCLKTVCFAQADTLSSQEADTTKQDSFNGIKGAFIPSMALLGTGVYFHFDHQLHPKQKFHDNIRSVLPENKSGMEDYFRYVPAAGVYAFDLFGMKARNGFVQRSALLGASQLLMTGMTLGLKNNLDVLRPNGQDYKSFPSGAAAQAFMSATFFHYEMRDHSPWLTVGAYSLAAVTGIMRITANKHWTGDVLFGAGIGMLSTHLVYWVFEKSVNRWYDKLFKSKHADVSFVPAVTPGFVGGSLALELK